MDILNICYPYLYYFVIYSIFGWCAEVIFCTLTTGKFTNRGFLNGPVCPIYGFGVLIVILSLMPLKENLFVLFLGSFILTSVLEFITGFILEKIFHEKWWDYSEEPFNIKGYVCIRFSIMWALACILIVRVVHPLIEKLVMIIPIKLGWITLIVLGVCFISDLTYTIVQIKNIRTELRIFEQISIRMRAISDHMGEKLADLAIDGKENAEKHKKSFEESHNKELEELKEKYQNLIDKKNSSRKRLHNAFPHLKLEKKYRFQDFSEKLKNEYHKHKR